MRRLGTAFLSAAVLTGTACGSAASSEAPESSTVRPAKPRLTVGALYPLVIRGSGFRAHEQVTVTVDGGRRGRRSVRADRAGGFTVRFTVRIPRCAAVTIRASGKQGSRVVYQPPRPNCREP